MFTRLGYVCYAFSGVFGLSGILFYIYTPNVVSKLLLGAFFTLAVVTFVLLGGFFLTAGDRVRRAEIEEALIEYHRTRRK